MTRLRLLISLGMAGVLIGSALVAAPAAALGGPLKVYILAGQSNMMGNGPVADLPPGLQNPTTGVHIYADGMVDSDLDSVWSNLQPGFAGGDNGFGPELSFGLDLEAASPNANIALIKWTWGGTDLANDWNPSSGWCYNGGTSDTNTNEQPGFKNTVLQQVAALKNSWSEVEIAGMIWMQGESDSQVLGDANNYETNLRSFIQSVRQDFGSPYMPFVLGRIKDSAVWPYRSQVRQAQANVAASLPNTTMINTDDLSLVDPYHYDAAGLLTLGSRFATALQSLTRTTEWSQPQGFASTQGANGWIYDEWNGAAYVPATWVTNHWQGSQPYTSMYPNLVHPDATDPAIGWRAPFSGPVVISGNVKKADITGGDGVNVSIIKKGATTSTLWGANPVSYNDSAGLNYNIATTVDEGDVIYFRTNQRSNNEFDSTTWTPRIRSAWNYAYDFSSVMGNKNWLYDEWNGSTYTPTSWVTDHWQGSQPYTYMYPDRVHPDSTDPAIGWRAPNSGTVVITGNVKKADLGGGDGVNVAIIKKGATSTILWGNYSIAYNDGVGLNYSLTTTVTQGEVIYFRTSRGANNSHDATSWTPQITLALNQ